MNFLMNASALLFPLITFPYVSRVLLSEGNGKVAFASSVVSYFMMVASLGIPTYGIRACAKVRDDKQALSKVVQELLWIHLTMTFLVSAVYAWMLFFVPKFASERSLFVINGASMLLNVFAMTWFYNALEQYAYITVCNLVGKVLSLVLLFRLVRGPSDYVVYAGITVLASSLSYLCNVVYARKFITFRKQGTYEFRRHIKPILIFFATSAAIQVYTNLDVVMLGFLKGDTAVGYYNASIKVKLILTMLITSLGTVLLPRLSYYVKQKNQDAFREMIQKAVQFVVVFGTPCTLFFLLFAKESILFLAGEDFYGAIRPMMFLMPTVLFIGLSNITGIQILTPQNEEKKVLYSILWGAVIDFLLNVWLIPKYAASGAAFATMIAELVVLVVQVVYLKSWWSTWASCVSWWKVAAASVLASLISMYFRMQTSLDSFWSLLFGGLLFMGSYGVFLLLVREPLLYGLWISLCKRGKKQS
jgi:O-antigen/teichoic acid export membrane protein